MTGFLRKLFKRRLSWFKEFEYDQKLYLEQEVGDVEGVNGAVFLGLNLRLRPDLADGLRDQRARAVNRERSPATLRFLDDHLVALGQHRRREHRDDDDELHLFAVDGLKSM